MLLFLLSPRRAVLPIPVLEGVLTSSYIQPDSVGGMLGATDLYSFLLLPFHLCYSNRLTSNGEAILRQEAAHKNRTLAFSF